MLIARFNKCSRFVKRALFRTYCLCLYNIGLWKYYNVTELNRFKACYHQCIKTFFGYDRMDSVTFMLLELNLPSFKMVIHNAAVSVNEQCVRSCNYIVNYMYLLGL